MNKQNHLINDSLRRINTIIEGVNYLSVLYPVFWVQAHPPGAINVQVYRLIKEWTAWDIARRAAFAFFGIFSGTEENPDFIQSML